MSVPPYPAARAIPAFMTTVGEDHLVRMPNTVPSGTRVAIVVVEDAERERTARFDAVLAAIRNAIAQGYTGDDAPSQDEIALVVKKARAARRAQAEGR